MDINKVIDNVLNDVANATDSNVNLENPYHQHLVRTGLCEHIDSNIVDMVMLSINEADDKEKKAFAKKYKFLASNANLFSSVGSLPAFIQESITLMLGCFFQKDLSKKIFSCEK